MSAEGPQTTLFTPVRPVRAYQRIVEQIEAALLTGELSPGERLPSERELMAQFAVSRSTVREALRVLESRGAVRSRAGDPNGPEILPFSPEELSQQMKRLARVEELTLAELIAFRMIIDSSANRLAARLRTEVELAEMEQAIEGMRATLDAGYEAFSQADVAFHDAIARASRNTLIQVCNQVVRGVVLDLISTKISAADNRVALMEQSMRHHEEVLSAIRSGEGVAAARISRQNLYDYYAGYVPEGDRAPLLSLLPEGDPAPGPS